MDRNILDIILSFNRFDNIRIPCKLKSLGLTQLFIKKHVNNTIPDTYFDDGFVEACMGGCKEIAMMMIKMCPDIHTFLYNKGNFVWQRNKFSVIKFHDGFEIKCEHNKMTITNEEIKNYQHSVIQKKQK